MKFCSNTRGVAIIEAALATAFAIMIFITAVNLMWLSYQAIAIQNALETMGRTTAITPVTLGTFVNDIKDRVQEELTLWSAAVNNLDDIEVRASCCTGSDPECIGSASTPPSNPISGCSLNTLAEGIVSVSVVKRNLSILYPFIPITIRQSVVLRMERS